MPSTLTGSSAMTERESVELEPARRSRWWLWIAIPLLVILGSGLLYVVSVNSSLNRLIAETDRLDPGWQLADIEARRTSFPPEQNAALRVTKTKGLIKQPFNQLYKDDELVSSLEPQQLLNDQQILAVKKLTAAATEAIAEGRTLIDFPHGRHAVAWSPDWISTILKCQDNRDVVRILRLDAVDCAQRGDADQALKSVHAAFHCGCSIGDEPMIISQLVRIACQAVALGALERVLGQCEPSDSVLEAFQKRLEAEEPSPLLLFAFRGERAGEYRLLEYMREGNVPGGLGTPALGGAPASIGLMSIVLRIPGVMASQTTGCIRFMNDMVELAKQPPETWNPQLATFRQQAAGLPTLARLLVPAIDSCAQAVQRSHAQQRCAIALVAAERFRKKNSRWPKSLDELTTAGLLKAVPIDPYDGKPLRLKTTADGLIIYSIGPDGNDNGGILDRAKPNKAGTDYGLQLWDVAHRRQPAPAERKLDENGNPLPAESPNP